MTDDIRSLDRLFGALSDPTRRAIIGQLLSGERSVGDLAEPFDISLPAISRHLRLLEDAGLIETRRDGQFKRVQLNREAFDRGANWFDRHARFWEGSMDKLAKAVEQKEGRT